MPRSWLRKHALFLTALLLGIAVRAVVMYAYRPALLFADTDSYLKHARDFGLSPVRPSGYSFFLRPFVLLGDSMAAVATVQHLMGLALAVACYAFLRRRGLPGWGATLATLPLLLDPLQLVLEHYILSDFLFEVMLVAACLVLLWRRRPGLGEVLVTGVLVGASGLVRGAGSFLIVAFVVAVVCLRVGWVKVVAFVVAAIMPLALYAVAFHQTHGEYAVSTYGPRFLYSRLAPIVDCDDPQLRLPDYEKKLCPPQPLDRRWNTNYYMWGSAAPKHIMSAQYHLTPPPGMSAVQVVKDFDKRVVRSQPAGYTKAVLTDFARAFAPARTWEVPGYPAQYWLFANHYWTFDTQIARGRGAAKRLKQLEGTHVDRGAADFMTGYQKVVYLPGPLSAALLLLAAAATLGLGRARLSGNRVAVGLLAGACLLPLLTGAALSGFSWRYQLPQIPLLPMAGALGLAALVRGRAAGQPEPDPPLRVLDGAARAVTSVPMPSAWRRSLLGAADRGRLQVVLAVVAGLLVAGVVAAGTVGTGWFLPRPGALVGAGAGLAAALTLVVARMRAGSSPPPEPVMDDAPLPVPDDPPQRTEAGR